MTTTTKLGDYIGRALVNPVPGSSDATDYLGRDVTASNKDYAGRALIDHPNHPPQLWSDEEELGVGVRRRLAATNEVQVVTLTGGADGGTFTLTYDEVETGNIAWNAEASAVDSALEALSNIPAGGVAVTGDAGGPWTVTFTGALAGTDVVELVGDDVVELVGDPALLTGGSDEAVTVESDPEGYAGGAELEVTVAGTTDTTAPIAPAVGATVEDGTVTWVRLK